MKICYCWVAAAVLLLSACGKQERREAVGMYKVLVEKRAAFAQNNAAEKDFVSSVRGWCTSITAKGGGTGAQLEQNASVAQDLAKSSASISAVVGQVRQGIYDQSIQEEFPKGVRSNLIGELTRRQRFLQEVRSALQDSATAFEGFRQSRGYKGDTYPAGIDKLTQILQGYHEPGDSVNEAISALTAKYNIKEGEPGT